MTEELALEKVKTERAKHRATIEAMKNQFVTRLSISLVIGAGLLFLAFWLGTVLG